MPPGNDEQSGQPTQPQALNVEQFAGAIKAKYPSYAQMDNSELVQRVITRYPQYGAKLAPEDSQRLGFTQAPHAAAKQIALSAALGAAGGASQAPETQTSLRDLAAGITAPPSKASLFDPTAGAAANAMGLAQGVYGAARDIYKGLTSGDYPEAAHGAGNIAGQAAMLLLGGRATRDAAPPETTIRVDPKAPPVEMGAHEIARATPLSETGKLPTRGAAVGDMGSPQPPGATVKPAVQVPTAWDVEQPWQITRDYKPPTVQASPPMGKPTVPEVHPQVEQRLQAVAQTTAAKPNPAAGEGTSVVHLAEKAPDIPGQLMSMRTEAERLETAIRNSPQAPQEQLQQAQVKLDTYRESIARLEAPQVAKPATVVSPPVRPEGAFQPADERAQEYAKQREAFRKQQRDTGINPDTGKSLEAKPDVHPVDQAVKRIVKASDTNDMARRVDELKRTVATHAENLDPNAMRAQAQRWTDQATELRRVAQAPEQIANLKETKGFGKWERTGVTAEEARDIKAEGGQVPRPGLMDLSGKNPAERDVLHELFGHATQTVLARDEEGRPSQLRVDSDEARQQLTGKIAEWQNEKRTLMANMGDFPSEEQIDRLSTLTEGLEAATGLREKVAGKGVPLKDANGVIRAPGVIPDIGQKTSNALMGKPESSHFAKATPEKLESRAVEAENYARIYGLIADNLEKRREGLPPAASITPEEVAAKRQEATKAGVVPSGQPVPVEGTAPLDPAKLETQSEISRLQAQLAKAQPGPEADRLKATIGAFQNELNPTARWDAGFPPGETSARTRDIVRLAHQATDPTIASFIRDAVIRQGLDSREATAKLYGRALGAYAKDGLDAAMRIARRDNEKGALRASFLRDIHDAMVPGRTGETPLTTAKQSVREGGAREAQYIARTTQQLTEGDKWFGKQPQAIQWQFQKDMQSGDWQTKYAPNSREYKYAELARNLLDENRMRIQNAKPGALREFDENYFPQRWQGINNLDDYKARVYGARSGLAKANFLKEKYHASLQAGENAGLIPNEYNPMRAVQNVLAEGAHYVKGQQIISDLRAAGQIQRFKSPRFVPDDYAMLNEKVAGRGQYAPAEVARMFNNYFDPGLFAKNRFLDTIRIYNNAAQIAGVSLSGYHALLTSHEALATDLSLAAKYVVSGNFPGAIRAIGRTVISPLDTMVRGDRFLRDYRAAMPADIANNPLMRAYLESGARPGISRAWDTGAINGVNERWTQAIKRGDYVGAANTALRFVPDTLRLLSKPIQDFWVPRMKAGATVKMLQYELERLGPGASDAERKAAFREVQDSADNRFGQMVTDNLFWNRTMRDAATLGFKFVDFNYGSIRELYGAAKDIPRATVGSGLSHRLAHALVYPASLAIGGAILQYMLTGKGPEDSKDYFFPRNGRTDAYGKPERLMIPSYERSFYEMGKPGVQLAQGQFQPAAKGAGDVLASRASPAVNLTKELYNNRDWLGNQIANPNEPLIQRIGAMIKEIASQAKPISMGSWERSEQTGGTLRDKALAVAGFNQVPSKFGLNQTPAEQELLNQLHEFHGGSGAAPEQLARSRGLNRLVATQRNDPGKFSQVYREEVQAGHIKPDEDLEKLETRLNTPFLMSVKELPLTRQVAVLEKATTPQERGMIMSQLKLDDLAEMGNEAQRKALWERIVAAQKAGGTH